MREYLRKRFGPDNPLDAVSFNLCVVFCGLSFLGCLFSCLYLNIDRVFIYILGIAGLLYAFGIGYVRQSANYGLVAFVLSLVLNVLIFPILYAVDGRVISFVMIYYMMGFFMPMFVCRRGLRIGAVTVFWVSWIFSLFIVYYRNTSTPREILDRVHPLFDVMIPFMVVSMLCILCVYFLMIYYLSDSLEAERSRAEADRMEKSKDIFLMNMSHEIRTPMNAIMSAGEIMTTRAIDAETEQNVEHVMSACKALISTIDDLLIFSKVENKGIVLVENEYDPGELLSDIINMISVRLMNSDVRFYVYIDPQLPSKLYGDVGRVRQVFINILNNAVKYTKKGHIILRVGMRNIMAERVDLHVSVEDSGIGIKEEMLPTLFDDFARVSDNMHESTKIEGTGLGLSITKAILDACQGHINVTSEYNKGSVFTFDIPQKIADGEPIASIWWHSSIGVVVYDEDPMSTDTVSDALRRLKVKCVSASSFDEIESYAKQEIYTHLIISHDHYRIYEDLIDGLGLETLVMREVGDAEEDIHREKITKPVNSLNLADCFEMMEEEEEGEEVKERVETRRGPMVSGLRALVVDDNQTNLIVADRLLKNEGFDVVTSTSGNGAVNLINSMEFDMIFIDYMMPVMDGVDTLRAIRKSSRDWARTVPCIVLTADAHNGAKQMLINAGFDDYLSKPINVDELEYMIRQYAPMEGLTEDDRQDH